jgi:hypothetical protein
MTSDQLLPCPFCGTAPIWAASHFTDDFEIQCPNQKCLVFICVGGKTESEAMTAWNTRKAEPLK